MNFRIAIFAGLLVLQGCESLGPADGPYRLEHRIPPVVETEPVASSRDAADDPAIWVNPDHPEASLIVGTDKQSGLYVYELDGSERQYLPLGYTNNVDLRTAPWGNKDFTLVAAGRRFPSQLLLLTLDHESGELRLLERHTVELREPYGICMYLDADQRPYVFLTSTEGRVAQYSVDPDFGIEEVRRFRFGSKVEGCVADDDDGLLYIGEEGRGIWRMPAGAEDSDHRILLDSVLGRHLTADVEGLAIYYGPRKLLIASSQGNNSFAIYDTATTEHLLSFHITGSKQVDDVSETDGLDVTAVSLPGYPDGILVVQDGYNLNPTENQNFKIVSWSDVLQVIETL
jgi:3-phytase